MTELPSSASASAPLFGRRNWLCGGLGVATIVAGYLVLSGGAASLAAVLLVVGYVVLIPMALLI